MRCPTQAAIHGFVVLQLWHCNCGITNDAVKLRQGIVYYLYDDKVLLNSDLFGVNDGLWHDVQLKWMKDEVWLNIDYGQYERTQLSHHSVGGKVVTKVTVGDANDKQNHLIGCVRVSLLIILFSFWYHLSMFSPLHFCFAEHENWYGQ